MASTILGAGTVTSVELVRKILRRRTGDGSQLSTKSWELQRNQQAEIYFGSSSSAKTGGKYADGVSFDAQPTERVYTGDGSGPSDVRATATFDNVVDEFWEFQGSEAHNAAKLASDLGTLPRGHLTISAHGSSMHLQDDRPGAEKGKRIILYGEHVVAFIRKHHPEIKPGMTIVLASCYPARISGNAENIAQYISNELQVTVIGPDKKLFIIGDGSIVIAGPLQGDDHKPDLADPGRWVTVSPEPRKR